MKESVAIAKEANRKKESSPTRSDNSILSLRDEPDRQIDSLRGVIGNIRRDGGKLSVESIATELSSMHTAQRAPALLALQQTHGNRYVQRVVAGIQAKLKVGQPGDVYEQEADWVADEVMQMPEPEVARQIEEEEELIPSKGISGNAPEVSDDLQVRLSQSKGGGQPLPDKAMIFMESRFGVDFSAVRIHADKEAAQMAREFNAEAFTHGRDIYFGAGRYSQGTSSGKRLLAHELAHVVQQRARTPFSDQFVYEHIGNMDSQDRGARELSSIYTPSLPLLAPLSIQREQLVIGVNVPEVEPEEHRDLPVHLGYTPPGPHPLAARAATNIIDIRNENILFDSWSNDCRDNNNDDRVDDSSENTPDGAHYNIPTYPGFKTKAINTYCTGTTDWETNTPVKYRVCADIVSHAYMQAGIFSSTARSVATILSWFRTRRNFRIWPRGGRGFPRTYLPGDFVCTYAAGYGGHAAMVVRAGSTNNGVSPPFVVHLPGPSFQIIRGVYDPTRTSDIRMEGWPNVRPQIDFLGRYVG